MHARRLTKRNKSKKFQAVKYLTCIQEIESLNLLQKNEIYEVLLLFPQYLEANAGTLIQIKPRPFRSASSKFIIHYHPTIRCHIICVSDSAGEYITSMIKRRPCRSSSG
jgi:hypothetical protein